tara:strand:- start:218 stop:1144 length:927 start_codon:yes stop_codon:yes gene_type:complete
MEQVIAGGTGSMGGQVVIKDTNTADFKTDVIDASMNAPVIVDFWAPWCGPCKQLTPILEKVVSEAGGKVQLIKLNIDEAQQIATQMQIQSVPAVYAFFQGRPVDGFMGAVPESQVRQFVDQLVAVADKAAGPSPIDEALEQAKATLEAGDASTAGAIYGQILQQEQTNVKAISGMGKCYLATGQMEAAKGLLESIADDQRQDPDFVSFQTALELATQANTSTGETTALKEKVAANPQDHQARYDLALAHYGDGANEEAIDALLEILRANQGWNEGAAREQLVKIFEALGDAHPDTVEGRQKMASILFA